MGETNSPSVAHVGYRNPRATEGESIFITDYFELYNISDCRIGLHSHNLHV